MGTKEIYDPIKRGPDPCFEEGPRFTIKHHLLRYAHPSSLRRTGMYASVLGISQALHLTLAGEPGNLQTAWFWCSTQRLMVDLGRYKSIDKSRPGEYHVPHSGGSSLRGLFTVKIPPAPLY